MRDIVRIGSVCVSLMVCAVGCGGGGGGSTPAAPPPNPLYVRGNGNDTNSGGDPAHALRTITKAAQLALDGYQIIVGPGTYPGQITTRSSGVAPNGLVFTADATGTMTGDAAGAILVNASGHTAGFTFSNSSGTTLDGFTIFGASDAGIVLKSHCDDFTVRNCIIHDNPGADGIRVQDSASVVLFNNLLYGNGGSGINLGGTGSGSPNAMVVSNTVYGSGFRSLTIGNTSAPSTDAFVHNNIFQNGRDDFGIKVITSPRSDLGYNGDFNLVFAPDRYSGVLKGNHDVNADARFVNPSGIPTPDFHLQSGSPAVNAGDALLDMPALADALHQRTTVVAQICDGDRLDIGYHYPATAACPVQ